MSGNTLRIQLVKYNDGSTYAANYSNFRVGDEASNYTMTFDCFIGGNAGKVLILFSFPNIYKEKCQYKCCMYIDDSRCIVNALENNSKNENGNAKNMAFSTRDRDNDKSEVNSCAGNMKGGWWYNKCTKSNLNGEYCETGQTCMTWTTSDSPKEYRGHKETMISVRRTSSTTDQCDDPAA